MTERFLLGLAAMAAFAGMLYELVLAQAMAAAWGATLGRYQFTMGVFIAAMGAGAGLASLPRFRRGGWAGLFVIEAVLTLLGAMTPLYCLGIASLDAPEGLLVLCFALWIALLGALVGAELPMLLALAESLPGNDGRRWTIVSRILAADYLGMLLAGAIFASVLLPWIGLFGAAFLGSCVSSIAAGLTALAARGVPGSTGRIRIAGAATLLASQAVLLATHPRVQELVVEHWYLRGMSR